MNFGGLLENLDPALLTQIMASIQQASDQPRMRIGVDANQSEINVPQQWPPQNAQQAFSGMPQLMPQPQPQPQPQIGILNQQAEQSPRAEARPEPKPEYNPQSPGILGKPMPEKMPTDPYAFDFKKNWPLLLLQFANGMGAGNTGRKKGQRIWGALASGATNTGNFLQQYPQQKMHETMMRGKVDEAQRQTELRAKFEEELAKMSPEQARAARFLGPEKYFDKLLASTPSGFNRDEKGNLSVDPGYAAYDLTKAKVGATQVINNLPGNPRLQTRYEQKRDEALAGQADELAKGAQSARDQINALDAMSAILPTIKTGPGAETLAELSRWGARFGINTKELNLPENPGAYEAFGALTNANALNKVAQMKGALSDKDREFVRSMGPTLQSTPEGNAALIDINKKLANRQIEVHNLMRAFERKFGTLAPTGAPSFDEFITEWAAKNPLFADFQVPTAPTQQQKPKKLIYNDKTGGFD